VNTAEEMAKAISHLLADPAARAHMEAAARARVEHAYNWDAIAAAQSDLWHEAPPCAGDG